MTKKPSGATGKVKAAVVKAKKEANVKEEVAVKKERVKYDLPGQTKPTPDEVRYTKLEKK